MEGMMIDRREVANAKSRVRKLAIGERCFAVRALSDSFGPDFRKALGP
jgi:hypothetical protein